MTRHSPSVQLFVDDLTVLVMTMMRYKMRNILPGCSLVTGTAVGNVLAH